MSMLLMMWYSIIVLLKEWSKTNQKASSKTQSLIQHFNNQKSLFSFGIGLVESFNVIDNVILHNMFTKGMIQDRAQSVFQDPKPESWYNTFTIIIKQSTYSASVSSSSMWNNAFSICSLMTETYKRWLVNVTIISLVQSIWILWCE